MHTRHRKHRLRGPVKVAGLRRAGRPSARPKPLKTRLHQAGITYREVATRAKRSYRTVQDHISGRFHSPAVQAAIETLLAGAA